MIFNGEIEVNSTKTMQQKGNALMNFIAHLYHNSGYSLNKKAWFTGLYVASLFSLTATGASVRWMLSSI